MNMLLNILISTVSWKGEIIDSSQFCCWHILVHGRPYTFPSNIVVVQNKEKKIAGIVVFSPGNILAQIEKLKFPYSSLSFELQQYQPF